MHFFLTDKEVKISRSTWKDESILRHLDERELATLDEDCQIMFYRKGETIFLQGNYIDGCYLALSGIVKQSKKGVEGRESILRLNKPFGLLGFRSVLGDEPACNTSIALVDSFLCYIPKESLHRLVKTNGDFALDLLQIACRELEESNFMITEIAQKSLKERLAELLLMLKSKFGVDHNGYIDISLSREEYASIVGTATESVIRLLSEFKAERYINVSGKKIEIINEKALEKITAT